MGDRRSHLPARPPVRGRGAEPRELHRRRPLLTGRGAQRSRRLPRQAAMTDALRRASGFSRRIWHRLYLRARRGAYLLRAHRGAETRAHVLGLAARITTHALYRQPGSGVSTARPGQWTDLDARWFMNDGSIRGAFVHADSLVWGRYCRNYGDLGGAVGRAGRPRPAPRRRQLVRLRRAEPPHHLGPDPRRGPARSDGGARGRRGRLALRAAFAASYGFAQVTSLAYPEAAPAFAGRDHQE